MLLAEQEVKTGDLNPMMDIFSAGCALTELFNEGHPPFDFSQLLGKRSAVMIDRSIIDRLIEESLVFFLFCCPKRTGTVNTRRANTWTRLRTAG